jgi:hypothetical protein
VIFNRATILFLFTFFLGNYGINAQQKSDTTKPKVPLRIVSFNENNLHFGNRSIQDTVRYKLDSFQIVQPFLISTGNLGAPGHLLLPQLFPAEAFLVKPDVFSYFGFNRYNRRFYKTNLPYTLLQYFPGQPKEQYVDVIHARNFGENLNFSFHFIRARSEGFYKRQNTSNTSVRTNLWYMSPAKHYSFMTDIFWTGENVAENGGLASDSSFEFADQIDRQVNEVNLNSAGNVQRKRGIWMKHTFAIGNVTDTLVMDTARSYHVITPAWGISLVSELFDEKYNYTDGDPTSGFYDIIFRDSTITMDSTYCWRINNSARLEKFNEYGAKSVHGFIGARHEAGEYFNDTIYRHFQNIYAEGSIGFLFDSIRHASAEGWYVLSGYNSGDYNVDLKAEIALASDRLLVTARGQMRGLSPAVIYMNYAGNNLRWQNSFSQVHQTNSELALTYTGIKSLVLKVEGRIINETDLLYFDETFLPSQYAGEITTSSAGLLAVWKAGWFNSATHLVYSKTSNESIIRLPEFLVQHTMFANVNLFKNAMQLQAGVDVTWFSEFTAEAYMPAVSQFYLQNSRTVGNYAYIDPWVSFRIKPVRVFIKAEHVNAGLMGRKYFLLDHYVHNDLAFKIGLSWLFND